MTFQPRRAFTHAGGIVVREADDSDGREILVVKPTKPGPAAWVLPKGHIEAGESAEDAALREVREEAGALCKNAAYVGYTAFRANGEDVVCAFYSMDLSELEPSEEDRDRRWIGYAELARDMPFEDTLGLVRIVLSSLP